MTPENLVINEDFDWSKTREDIRCAAAIITAREAKKQTVLLQRQAGALDAIVILLNNLGDDGIHQVIRAHRASLSRSEKMRRAKARAARQRAKETA